MLILAVHGLAVHIWLILVVHGSILLYIDYNNVTNCFYTVHVVSKRKQKCQKVHCTPCIFYYTMYNGLPALRAWLGHHGAVLLNSRPSGAAESR